jgi:hypothetical protein
MLYFVAAWMLLAAVCLTVGTALLQGFRTDCFNRRGDRFIIAIWLGIVVLAIALLSASLVFPLSPLVGSVVAACLVLLSLLSRRTRTELGSFWSRLSPSLLAGFLALTVVVAAVFSKQVTWFDTGLYHFGAIRWLADYGTVPGLALIISQFGFTSSWFAFAAPLNPEWFGSRVSAVTNGFVFLIALAQFFISLNYSLQEKSRLADWFVAVFWGITLPMMLLTTFMSAIPISPSPDIPVILLTGAIAWAILLISKFRSTPSPSEKNSVLDVRIIPLILGAGAVTMKLSALPLLLVSGLFYCFKRKFRIKRLLAANTIAGVILLPMATAGTVASGCPLYPSSFMCFDLPWSIPTQKAIAEADAINGWKSWFGSPPPDTNYWLWVFGEWFNGARFNQVIVALIIVSIIYIIFTLRSAKLNRLGGEIWLLLLGGVGMAFIMVKAPLIRFGLGYFLIVPGLLIATCMRPLKDKILSPIVQTIKPVSESIKLPLIAPFLSLFLIGITIAGFSHTKGQSRLLLPPELPEDRIATQQVNNIEYSFPIDSGKCWAAELPCVGEPSDRENVQLRNPSRGIEAGFIRTQ